MAQRQLSTCSICSTDKFLIITCGSGQHIFCNICVTNCVVPRTRTNNAMIGPTEGLSCPFSNQCQSQFDFDLLRDILGHNAVHHGRIDVDQELRILEVTSVISRGSRINCPNEECSYFYSKPEEETFEELFFSCPSCEGNFCLTCKNRLSIQGYSDHLCPPDKGVTDADANMRLHEVLTEAVAVRCPNEECSTTDQGRALAIKEPGDCNAMTCGECHRFFCFICCKDLGTESQQAHQAFPHRNMTEEGAPPCWIFDDEERGLTDDLALKIRQLTAVTNYLVVLEMSDERKEALLCLNRKVLGDLYWCLRNRITKPKEKRRK